MSSVFRLFFIGVNNFANWGGRFKCKQFKNLHHSSSISMENGLYLGVTVANTTHFLPSNLLWKRLESEAQKKTIYWRHSPRNSDLDLKCFHLSIVSCWQCTLIIVFDLIEHVHFTWLNHMHAHARHISYFSEIGYIIFLPPRPPLPALFAETQWTAHSIGRSFH